MDKFAKIKENLILSLLLLMLFFVIGELGHIYIRVMPLQCKDITQSSFSFIITNNKCLPKESIYKK